MMQCENIHVRLALYLDDELHNGERDDFEAHLQECADCRQSYEIERQEIEAIRTAQPLYTAPPELRARIATLLDETPSPYVAPHPLRQRLQQMLRPTETPTFVFRPARLFALAAVLCIVVFAGFWASVLRRNATTLPAPSEFAQMAVDTHVRRVRGQLPLEINSHSPAEISGWFAGKVSFSLKLPNYQEDSGQVRLYNLEGARLVGFRKDYAALVAYDMDQHPITLVVTSNGVAMPSGGEQVVSKGLRFHYDTLNGWKVITWADRGLTYALVSDLAGRGQQSCIVCHEGTQDREIIEGLKPGRTQL
jgi:anti-sigma factor (TIGR02949 family)